MKTLIETNEVGANTFEITIEENGVQRVIKFKGTAKDLKAYVKQYAKPKKAKKDDDVESVVNLEVAD